MRYLIPVTILFLLLISCKPKDVENKDVTFDDNFVKANAALLNKDFTQAVAFFDKVLKKYPKSEKALLLRSQANYSLKNYREVIKDCEKILRIKSKIVTNSDYTAIWDIGTAYNSLGEFSLARQYFNKAKGLDSTDLRLYESVAYSYLEENKLDSALIELQSMLKYDNNSEKAYFGIGKVKFLQKKYKDAVEAFDKAILIKKDYVIAYQNRGSAKLELNDNKGCCEDWKKCQELGMTGMEPFLKQVCK